MGAFFVFFEIALHIVIKSFKFLNLFLVDYLKKIFSLMYCYVLLQKLEKIIESSNSVLNSIRTFFI